MRSASSHCHTAEPRLYARWADVMIDFVSGFEALPRFGSAGPSTALKSYGSTAAAITVAPSRHRLRLPEALDAASQRVLHCATTRSCRAVDQSRSDALTGIIGARRACTVSMISPLSMPCGDAKSRTAPPDVRRPRYPLFVVCQMAPRRCSARTPARYGARHHDGVCRRSVPAPCCW